VAQQQGRLLATLHPPTWGRTDRIRTLGDGPEWWNDRIRTSQPLSTNRWPGGGQVWTDR